MNIATRSIVQAACLAVLLAVPAACMTESNGIDIAEAEISPANSGNVSGIVRFNEQAGYVQVTGTLEGLESGNYAVVLYGPGTCDDLNNEAGDAGVAAGDRHVADIARVPSDHLGRASIDTGRTDLPRIDGSADMLGNSVVVVSSGDGLDAAAGCGVVRPVPDIDYTL